MATKVDAARIAAGAGVPTVLAHADAGRGGAGRCGRRHLLPPDRQPRAGAAALAGARDDRRAAAACSTPARSTAVVQRRSSLLPAGITAVEGEFSAGDPVDLLDDRAA